MKESIEERRARQQAIDLVGNLWNTHSAMSVASAVPGPAKGKVDSQLMWKWCQVVRQARESKWSAGVPWQCDAQYLPVCHDATSPQYYGNQGHVVIGLHICLHH